MDDTPEMMDGPDMPMGTPLLGRGEGRIERARARDRGRERPEPEAHVLARVMALASEEQTFRVFDDVVTGTAAVYSPPGLDDSLGVFDKLAIQAVVNQVTGAGAMTLTVSIEHSNDRCHWVAKSATPEIDAVALSSTDTTVALGADAGAVPSLGFVRLGISLAVGIGTPSARITVHVRAR